MEYCVALSKERERMYEIINYLFIICIRKNLKLIVENPYSKEHFLTRYWCLEPEIIDKDRRNDGDYFAKPTQYWFVNFKPKFNFLIDSCESNFVGCKNAITKIKKEHWEKIGANNLKEARSMIAPTYANRFIRRYLLEGKE